MNSEVCFLGVGDCGPTTAREQGFTVDRYSELIRPTLASADLRFGNCERAYSSRRTGTGLTPHGCQPPEMAQFFTDCGFDAVTIANNHMHDYGPEPVLDTRALLLQKGIQVTGGGRNLAEARMPAIVECKGIRVGFLGYCSVLPPGAEAGSDKAGIAPLRVNTRYEHRGPHVSPRVLTEPDAVDLEMIVEDVKALRKQVDIVIPNFHWGVLWLPRIISDYQVAVAHACIDAGADLVMGHHSHIPRAIEVYKGKPIFYSLGDFCLTNASGLAPRWNETPWVHGAARNHTDPDPAYQYMPYGKECKMTLLIKAILTKRGAKSVSFLPAYIDEHYRPFVVRNGDARFNEIVRFMEWTSAGFDHNFDVQGDEVVVSG